MIPNPITRVSSKDFTLSSSYNIILSLFGRKRHRLLPLAERYSSYTTATGDSNGGLAKQVARVND